MTTSTTEQQLESVRALLLEMGATSEEVANTLRREGIKGDRGTGFSCPVANYLQAKGQDGILVLTNYCTAVDDNGKEVLDVENPEPVSNFIRDFDEGNDFHDLSTGEDWR